MEKDSSKVTRLFVVVGVMALQVLVTALGFPPSSFFCSTPLIALPWFKLFVVAVDVAVLWLLVVVVESKARKTDATEDEIGGFDDAVRGLVGVEANRGGDLGRVENEERGARLEETDVERMGEERVAAESGEPRDIGDTMVASERVDGGIATDTGLRTCLELSAAKLSALLFPLLLPLVFFWLAFLASLLVIMV